MTARFDNARVGGKDVWDGSQFGPDDPGKYPGEQRLKITFEVKPGASRAWLHYYNELLGALALPPGTACLNPEPSRH